MYYSDEELLALTENDIDHLANPSHGGAPKISSYFMARWEELQRELFLEESENAISFIDLAKIMGFKLSNYDELENLTPQDIAANLELRAWLFELNVASEAYMVDFDRLGVEKKKQIIETHIKHPIVYERERHKSKSAVQEMKIPFSWTATDNGALWAGEYKTHDQSIKNRVCVAIDPYAPIEDIQAAIRRVIFNQQKEIENALPPTPKGGKNQQAYKEAIINQKVLQIIDLYLVKSVFNLYSDLTTYANVTHFNHGEISKFQNLIQQWDDQYRRFEKTLFKYLEEPFIFWMKSNQNDKKNLSNNL